MRPTRIGRRLDRYRVTRLPRLWRDQHWPWLPKPFWVWDDIESRQ